MTRHASANSNRSPIVAGRLVVDRFDLNFRWSKGGNHATLRHQWRPKQKLIYERKSSGSFVTLNIGRSTKSKSQTRSVMAQHNETRSAARCAIWNKKARSLE